MKRYCKFSDGSIAFIEIDKFFVHKPEFIYTHQMLGFGKWISWKEWNKI